MRYRQIIIDTLKANFKGVSDKIIGRLADKLAAKAETEEDAKAAAEAVTFQQVLDSYGDSRATEASLTAVKNYESKYGLKDGVSTASEGDGKEDPANTSKKEKQPKGAETMPAWAQALVDSNKKLNEELANMKRGRVTETRQAQLAEITSQLPENLRKAYARTPVDKLTDEEFETLKSDITTEVGGLQTELAAKGAVFGKPAANHGGQPDNELTQAQQAAIAHREGMPTADKQPF